MRFYLEDLVDEYRVYTSLESKKRAWHYYTALIKLYAVLAPDKAAKVGDAIVNE